MTTKKNEAVLDALDVGESRFFKPTQSQRDAGYKFLNVSIANLEATGTKRFSQRIVSGPGGTGVRVTRWR